MEINSIYDCFTADKDINRVDGCYIRIRCCTLGGIYLQYDLFFLRRDLKGVVMDLRDDDKGRWIIFST